MRLKKKKGRRKDKNGTYVMSFLKRISAIKIIFGFIPQTPDKTFGYIFFISFIVWTCLHTLKKIKTV